MFKWEIEIISSRFGLYKFGVVRTPRGGKSHTTKKKPQAILLIMNPFKAFHVLLNTLTNTYIDCIKFGLWQLRTCHYHHYFAPQEILYRFTHFRGKFGSELDLLVNVLFISLQLLIFLQVNGCSSLQIWRLLISQICSRSWTWCLCYTYTLTTESLGLGVKPRTLTRLSISHESHFLPLFFSVFRQYVANLLIHPDHLSSCAHPRQFCGSNAFTLRCTYPEMHSSWARYSVGLSTDVFAPEVTKGKILGMRFHCYLRVFSLVHTQLFMNHRSFFLDSISCTLIGLSAGSEFLLSCYSKYLFFSH